MRQTRQTHKQLVDLCEEEGLDGIDFDWEDGEKELQKSIIFQFTNSNLRHQGQG